MMNTIDEITAVLIDFKNNLLSLSGTHGAISRICRVTLPRWTEVVPIGSAWSDQHGVVFVTGVGADVRYKSENGFRSGIVPFDQWPAGFKLVDRGRHVTQFQVEVACATHYESQSRGQREFDTWNEALKFSSAGWIHDRRARMRKTLEAALGEQ